MDLDAGSGAPVGPLARPGPLDFGLSRRMRALLDTARPRRAPDPVGPLLRAHRAIHPYMDAGVLRRAYVMAESAHRGQFRKSGEPFITHPVAVAQILADLGMDTTTLVAALLHDTVEDTDYTLHALRDDFGGEVAHLVDGVTKFDKLYYGQAAKGETIRKLIIAAGRDVRVLVIKLADRLHNMRTLDARSPASRARIARDTQEVLVPLCDRLGIQALKRDLEDAVLRHLEPEAYGVTAEYAARRDGAQRLAAVLATTRRTLRRHGIAATVRPRPRHLYSIWQDTRKEGHREPHVLPRVAVVVDGAEADCYEALGAVHGLWRPVAGRFKDFIAAPKHNLYRSLHTTVVGPDDGVVEILIRTAAMHRTAEYGIAAGFRYPNPDDRDAAAHEPLDWLQRVLAWQEETADTGLFLAALRCDLAEAQIKVFAHGATLLLPEGATPVDVAYELGPQTGEACLAARINGRLSPLSSPLSDGDLVEIFTEMDAADDAPVPRGPRREWLTFTRSGAARRQIQRYFAEGDAVPALPEKVRRGRGALYRELRRRDRGLLDDDPLRQLADHLGYPDHETLLVAIVDGQHTADDIATQLITMVDQGPTGVA
ncbi:MAG TPA: HD domain-containing protein [Pilimelia sp.]|nr:HD domain-containing protein [Pilimelia sp.]